MRPEARERFLLAADSSARALGASSFQDAIATVRRLFVKLTEQSDMIQTPELASQVLDDLEIAPELEEILIQLMENGPLLARWGIMELYRMAGDLPTLPSRQPAVSGRAQVEIVRFINKLNFEQNVPMQIAKKRAAQHFGCGVRTVERYWRERQRILANGPQYHFNDLLKEAKAIIDSDMAADTAAVSEHHSGPE